MKRTFLGTMLLALGLQGMSGFAQEVKDDDVARLQGFNQNGVTRGLQARADGAGNGGGAWACRNKDQLQTIRWVKFVDLYEAEKEFPLQLKTFGSRDYQKIVDAQKARLFSVNKNLYERLRPYFEEVEDNIREVDVDLEIIDDALYRVYPPARDCLGGTIKYIQLANFTYYGAVLINQHFFNNAKLSEIDKAGLMFHEAIYAFLRDRHGDTTSVRTREIVGYIFSTLKNSEIREKIDLILGYTSGGVFGMEFAPIYGGSFTMGSPSIEPNRGSDEQQRHVTITYNYEMMTTEVTQAMYFEMTGINPSKFKNQEYCPLSFESRISHTTGRVETLCPNNPVEKVSFNDVKNFIAFLNAKTEMNYRLPTEAEWEYAARAGSQSTYSFGDNATLLSEYAIYSGNSGSKTHPVGAMRNYANNPNHNGIYDMYGNVWEWTQDWYNAWTSGRVNPTGHFTGSLRVKRGGSYYDNAKYLRSAYRGSDRPSNQKSNLGFRLVRTLY